MAEKSEIVIKKYPNRRLYDTSTSAYITLDDVKRLVVDKKTVKVLDAKTNEDLTRQTLMQIMLEEEAGGHPIFTADMLAQVISFYGHAQHSALGPFLETSLKNYVNGAEAIAKQAAAMKSGTQRGADVLVAANAAAWGEVAKAQQAALASLFDRMGQAGAWMAPKGKQDK
jgi:polyhydroxyalkanoate synthesis repressor PhaR